MAVSGYRDVHRLTVVNAYHQGVLERLELGDWELDSRCFGGGGQQWLLG